MRDGKICFGLAGLGMGGETHARQIKRLENATLLAAYGRDEDKVRAFAHTFGVAKTFTRFEDMLADSEIDIVNVATPTGFIATSLSQPLRQGSTLLSRNRSRSRCGAPRILSTSAEKAM